MVYSSLSMNQDIKASQTGYNNTCLVSSFRKIKTHQVSMAQKKTEDTTLTTFSYDDFKSQKGIFLNEDLPQARVYVMHRETFRKIRGGLDAKNACVCPGVEGGYISLVPGATIEENAADFTFHKIYNMDTTRLEARHPYGLLIHGYDDNSVFFSDVDEIDAKKDVETFANKLMEVKKFTYNNEDVSSVAMRELLCQFIQRTDHSELIQKICNLAQFKVEEAIIYVSFTHRSTIPLMLGSMVLDLDSLNLNKQSGFNWGKCIQQNDENVDRVCTLDVLDGARNYFTVGKDTCRINSTEKYFANSHKEASGKIHLKSHVLNQLCFNEILFYSLKHDIPDVGTVMDILTNCHNGTFDHDKKLPAQFADIISKNCIVDERTLETFENDLMEKVAPYTGMIDYFSLQHILCARPPINNVNFFPSSSTIKDRASEIVENGNGLIRGDPHNDVCDEEISDDIQKYLECCQGLITAIMMATPYSSAVNFHTKLLNQKQKSARKQDHDTIRLNSMEKVSDLCNRTGNDKLLLNSMADNVAISACYIPQIMYKMFKSMEKCRSQDQSPEESLEARLCTSCKQILQDFPNSRLSCSCVFICDTVRNTVLRSLSGADRGRPTFHLFQYGFHVSAEADRRAYSEKKKDMSVSEEMEKKPVRVLNNALGKLADGILANLKQMFASRHSISSPAVMSDIIARKITPTVTKEFYESLNQNQDVDSLNTDALWKKIEAGIDFISTVHNAALTYISIASNECIFKKDMRPKHKMTLSPHTSSLGAMFGPAMMHIHRSSMAEMCASNAMDELCREIKTCPNKSLSNFKPKCHSMTLDTGSYPPFEIKPIKINDVKVRNLSNDNNKISDESKTINIKKCARIILKTYATKPNNTQKQDQDEKSPQYSNNQRQTGMSSVLNSIGVIRKQNTQHLQGDEQNSFSSGFEYSRESQHTLDSQHEMQDPNNDMSSLALTEEEAQSIKSKISVCPESYFNNRTNEKLFQMLIDKRLKQFILLLFSTTKHTIIRDISSASSLGRIFTILKDYGLLKGRLPHLLFKMQQAYVSGETVHAGEIQSLDDLAGSYFTNLIISMMPEVHPSFRDRLVIPRVYQICAEFTKPTINGKTDGYWKPAIKIPADCCLPLNDFNFFGIVRSEYIAFAGTKGNNQNYRRNDLKPLTQADLKLLDQPRTFKKGQSVSVPTNIFNRNNSLLSMITMNISDCIPVYGRERKNGKNDFQTYTTAEDDIESALNSGDLTSIITVFKNYCKGLDHTEIEGTIQTLVQNFTPWNISMMPAIIKGILKNGDQKKEPKKRKLLESEEDNNDLDHYSKKLRNK